MIEEDSDSDFDSEGTSELLTEDVENDQLNDRHDDEDDGSELSGSIYQKGGSIKQLTDSQLRRAKTSNLGKEIIKQQAQPPKAVKKVYQAEDGDAESVSFFEKPENDNKSDQFKVDRQFSNHWDQALVSNARQADVNSGDRISTLNATRIISDYDDKTDEEDKEGWFKE